MRTCIGGGVNFSVHIVEGNGGPVYRDGFCLAGRQLSDLGYFYFIGHSLRNEGRG